MCGIVLFHLIDRPSEKQLHLIIFLRYNGLAEPLQARRETLESWQLLFQFYRDLEDELLWIQDKLQGTVTKDLGTSLQSIQTIVKKHLVSLVQNSVTIILVLQNS